MLRRSNPKALLGSPLTAREAEVVMLICSGFGPKQVAANLGVAKRTVEIHRFRATQKLGAQSTAHMAVLFILGNANAKT